MYIWEVTDIDDVLRGVYRYVRDLSILLMPASTDLAQELFHPLAIDWLRSVLAEVKSSISFRISKVKSELVLVGDRRPRANHCYQELSSVLFLNSQIPN